MKKLLLFLFGVVVGVIGTFVAFGIIVQSQGEGLTGLTIFDSPADCITKSNLRVFQVQTPDKALAAVEEEDFNPFHQIVVLLVNETGKTYYDNEKITIPKGKCARQVGVFQYETKNHDWKTVPVVEID